MWLLLDMMYFMSILAVDYERKNYFERYVYR